MHKPDKKQKARPEIRLNAKQYDAFAAALNAPMKSRTRLEELFATQSVLE
jgi:uncharacterized protein (DUF1778 family)